MILFAIRMVEELFSVVSRNDSKVV